MTRPASGVRARLRSSAHRIFYRLPERWKRRIVRLVQPTYTVGAIMLVRDADAQNASTHNADAHAHNPDAHPRDAGNGDARDGGTGVAGHGAAPAGRLLLLRQPPGAGWSLPGGLMDRGERPVECAARELAEETGLRVPLEAIRPARPNAIVHHRGQWVDVVFETEVSASEPLTIDPDEVIEAAWHRLDALPPLTVPTARLLAHYGIGPYADYPEVLEQ